MTNCKPNTLPPPILIDVMQDGRFVCQLHYTGKERLEEIDGQILRVLSETDIRKWINKQRPSLRNKKINIRLSNNRV